MSLSKLTDVQSLGSDSGAIMARMDIGDRAPHLVTALDQ